MHLSPHLAENEGGNEIWSEFELEVLAGVHMPACVDWLCGNKEEDNMQEIKKT